MQRNITTQLNSVYESGSLQSNLLVHSVIRIWKLDSISTTHQGAGSLSCPLPPKYPRHSLVAQEDTYRNTWDCQNWICWAPITTKTTSVAGSRHTYAIQPSSTSSTLWRTATRTKTSWLTKAALLWPHKVRAQEMQHPRISARGTRRRQGSV